MKYPVERKVSILFHTGKSLGKASAITITKKESISTVFRYRRVARELRGN